MAAISIFASARALTSSATFNLYSVCSKFLPLSLMNLAIFAAALMFARAIDRVVMSGKKVSGTDLNSY